jgi:hypothetical protein
LDETQASTSLLPGATSTVSAPQPQGMREQEPMLPSLRSSTTNAWPSWEAASSHAAGVVNEVGRIDTQSTNPQLFNAVKEHGASIATTAVAGMESMHGGLSYESLTEGFMTHGESMTTHMIDYTSVEIWEYGQPQ